MKPFKWNEPSEKDIESAILYFLNYQVGCFAFKIDTKASFDPRIGTFRRLSRHVLPGTPDILCCYSVGGLGIFVGFEVKAEKGRQSKHQVEFQERLQDRASGFYYIVRSVKEVEDALKYVKDHVECLIKQT